MPLLSNELITEQHIDKDVNEEFDKRLNVVRAHFEKKGYRVHSGFQFGCELVLYADDPDIVHSDFCVHIVPPDSRVDWRMIQTLVRSQSDLHKTLILANIREIKNGPNGLNVDYEVDEIAISTEHAPFRHKNIKKEIKVGGQVKKRRVESEGKT